MLVEHLFVIIPTVLTPANDSYGGAQATGLLTVNYTHVSEKFKQTQTPAEHKVHLCVSQRHSPLPLRQKLGNSCQRPFALCHFSMGHCTLPAPLHQFYPPDSCVFLADSSGH